jgi:hypothetical protein
MTKTKKGTPPVKPGDLVTIASLGTVRVARVMWDRARWLVKPKGHASYFEPAEVTSGMGWRLATRKTEKKAARAQRARVIEVHLAADVQRGEAEVLRLGEQYAEAQATADDFRTSFLGAVVRLRAHRLELQEHRDKVGFVDRSSRPRLQ